MNIKKTYFLIFILGALFLSACTGSSRLTASSWPGITATDELVYVAYGPHIYALDAVSGSQRWSHPVEADNSISFYSAPALTEDGQQLVIGGYDNVLYSFDPNGFDAVNGLRSNWVFEDAKNLYIGGVLVTEDSIYAPNADGYLYAFDTAGQPKWPNLYSAEEPIWSTPVSDGEVIYIAALDHHIHAVNTRTGTDIWSQDLETVSVSSPAISDGTLYAATFGNKVFALDTRDGRILWTFETKDWAWGSPAVADGTIYFGDISGNFYAVNSDNGALRWEFTAEGGIFGGALIVEDMIYFGTESGKVYALNSDGGTEWFYSLTGKIYSTPVTNGEYLFIGSIEGDALVTALDFNGTARWPFAPEN